MIIDTNTTEGREALEFHYLRTARAAAREGVWRDLLMRFDDEQRKDLAILLAHDWTICELKIESSTDYRGNIETKIAALSKPTKAQFKAMREKARRASQGEESAP